MYPGDELSALSRDHRLTELATIFAAAILRLRARAALVAEPESDSASTCLEVPAETVLSGHHG